MKRKNVTNHPHKKQVHDPGTKAIILQQEVKFFKNIIFKIRDLFSHCFALVNNCFGLLIFISAIPASISTLAVKLLLLML